MVDRICIILLNICVIINCLHIRYIYKALNEKINRYVNYFDNRINNEHKYVNELINSSDLKKTKKKK